MQKLIFPEITKAHYRMHVSKTTPSIMRLFASLNIHYNKNAEVQKQNETKSKETSNKSCSLIAIHFLNRQAMTTISGINFNNTNRLHLVLVIRIYFHNNFNYPKVYTKVARLLVK